MSEQNVTPGANPRMWQGREIMNDMPIGRSKQFEDVIPEPANYGEYYELTEHETVLLEHQPAYSEMRKQTEEMMARVVKQHPVRITAPKPSFVGESLDRIHAAAKTTKSFPKKAKPVFVTEPRLTHRPFRAALANYFNQEK